MLGREVISLLSLGATVATAYPDIAKYVEAQRLNKRQGGFIPPLVEFPEFPGTPNHALFNEFDADIQKVSVEGDHEFRSPGPGDIRGPCAGLNAAANHGYLPRDGIATPATVNTGLWEAFGLDSTATIFLQTATAFFNGDPLSGRWSIGFHSDKTNSLGALGDALGNQTGICAYGHLKTEADASITRGDWLAPEFNSNCASYPQFLQELFDLAEEMNGPEGNITPRVMAEHSHRRKQYSIATNPNYFSPPYAGVAFTWGAHMFAYSLLANHSEEFPRGYLSQQTFMDFFGYTRNGGQLEFTYGSERIPENWFKRHDADPWTLADIAVTTAQQCASYPSNCEIGGNTGTVNSFSGIDVGDISGGLFNAADLADPGKLGCFISQNLQAEVPSFLSKVANGFALRTLLAAVNTKLLPAIEGLGVGGPCTNMPEGRTMADFGSSYPALDSPDEGSRNPF